MISKVYPAISTKVLLTFIFRGSNSSGRCGTQNRILSYSTVESFVDNITSPDSGKSEWITKIIYNDVLQKERMNYNIKIRKARAIAKRDLIKTGELTKGSLVFMKCLSDSVNREENTKNDENEKQTTIHFPYDIRKNFLVHSDINVIDTEVSTTNSEISQTTCLEEAPQLRKKFEFENPRKWEGKINEEILCDDRRFGSCDPSAPISKVPCGGCGALLHCTDMALPGFMPKEIFKDLTEKELRANVCQRCLFLAEYNIALGINVNPEEYPKILSRIKNQNVLVILLVDLLDFPCSVWPNILEVIGKDRPVFLVGNKIDLLIQDGENFIQHRKDCLINAVQDVGLDNANIKHVALISAKTGYGVDNLISKLFQFWCSDGDIYIVGCTNAGKSTLFNTLIQSDFCRVKATDLLQRATVSQWPGTTLNLLKFPILRPVAWQNFIRSERLKATREQEKAFKEVQKSMVRNKEKDRQISLMGYISQNLRNSEPKSTEMVGLDPNDFKTSKWCYDTPGVVHEAQILNLLTTYELSKVLPRRAVIPRNFKLTPGNTLFIGGLARLDFVSGCPFAWFTVYASHDLPVTIIQTEDADLVYDKLLGTHLFVVPQGNEERLRKWPRLSPKNLKVNGKFMNVGAGDVVLSSAGWIAITTNPCSRCELRAWTPDKRGIFLREPSIIRTSSSFRNRKIQGTPAYETSVEVIENNRTF